MLHEYVNLPDVEIIENVPDIAPYFSDSSLQKPYKLHDVGTGDDPTEKMGPAYDTPTLDREVDRYFKRLAR